MEWSLNLGEIWEEKRGVRERFGKRMSLWEKCKSKTYLGPPPLSCRGRGFMPAAAGTSLTLGLFFLKIMPRQRLYAYRGRGVSDFGYFLIWPSCRGRGFMLAAVLEALSAGILVFEFVSRHGLLAAAVLEPLTSCDLWKDIRAATVDKWLLRQ